MLSDKQRSRVVAALSNMVTARALRDAGNAGAAEPYEAKAREWLADVVGDEAGTNAGAVLASVKERIDRALFVAGVVG